ncbi:MAG: PaaI family thioesterase [Rhodopseudomonas sp.]|uniref:PaaI family thioesterase n=1 Tax=Rhodopseudomonas sp. TaxID=1078 RepID=UPI0017AD9961|nr:PaaI family thioesterase [Rhodopseudomonas sp.]NVN86432.1 PaaI family thioesterase [Rhodopseudomonas sp.]
MTDVPEGFQPFEIGSGFIHHNGPYFWRKDAAGQYDFGFQSDVRHGNPNGVLHGGAVLAFLDTVLGFAVVIATQRKCATVSLDTRFISTVPPGGWIDGRVIIKKLTRSLAFVDAEAFAGDKLLVTTGSVFRIFEA